MESMSLLDPKDRRRWPVPSRRWVTLILATAATAALAAPAFCQTTTYSFTGVSYTAVQPPYLATQRLSGSFTVAAPLPAFRPLSDLAPALAAMSFHDGVEGQSLADSFICRFEIATDGAGAVTQWRILLRRSPYNPLDPQHSIETLGNVGILQGADFVGTGPAGVNPCDPIVAAPAASSAAQGSWISDHPQPSLPTIYTYAGRPYTSAAPPYSLGGQLSGSVTFANPLPAFLPLADVTPALAGFAFSDGVESRTFANSFVCRFEVATDGAGAISRWHITLARSPYNPGDPHHVIESFGQPGVLSGIDVAGTGTAGPGPCDAIALAPMASSSAQGSWISSQPLPPDPSTYNYTGDPYTSATPPYSLGGAVQGSLTLAGPLPPYLPLTDVTPAIVAFAFDDGVETRTLADSFLCAFEVATDGTGNITRWRISLRRFPYNTGDPHHAIDSNGQPGVVQGADFAGSGTAPADPCGVMALSPFGSSNTQGIWQTDHPLPLVPTLYRYTGAPYVSALPPYASGGNLTGSLAVDHPLPPFLPLTDITPAIVGLAFSDGVATRALADSFLCRFEVATDGAGAITRWQIGLREFPYAPLSPQHAIESSGLPDPFGGIDLVGTGDANAAPCGTTSLDPYASSGMHGTWTNESATSVVEIPALDRRGILILVLALGALAMSRLRA
ncbi:MAG: hypothetical protein ABI639_15565 [Thermoanaerobaculia bacterium]